MPTPRTPPATCPGHVWALDFLFDSNFQNKAFTICNAIDENTGEHGGFEVGWSITATAVIDLLENVSCCTWQGLGLFAYG